MESEFLSPYEHCTLCPRSCGINRKEKRGFCEEGDVPYIVWAGLHKGEEGPISGENGSGMLFFRGCSLGCSTCQNKQISSQSEKNSFGRPYTIEKIVSTMLSLQKMGATTISFVTAEHFAPSVALAIRKAREQGLTIPTVFNTSGFISENTIKILLPYIDIWLWDTKTLSSKVASKYFGTASYPSEEEKSLSFLTSVVDSSKMESTYPRGIIVRHLVLPSHISESKEVIKNFALKYKDKCYFSLMYQFIPMDTKDEALLKKLTEEEVESLENLLYSYDIENGFVQELSETEEDWRPDFKRPNPFPSSFAKPL